VFQRLPEYPWQKLAPYRAQAAKHSDGAIDLSVGSPVDPTPELIQQALLAASNAPGYPSTAGVLELRQAIVDWFARRRGVSNLSPDQVIPTIGSKEFISWLPVMLGLGAGDTVVQPAIRYTAYEVGAKLAGSEIIASDDPSAWPASTRLIWLNSPANPHGAVMSVNELRAAAARARELGAVLVSDECYAEMGWVEPWLSEGIPCLLDPRVTEGDLTNLITIYSLSKQSNLAGYRAALAAGDQALIAELLNLRMHAGMMTPYPVQRAMIAALNDDGHVQQARAAYQVRRELLLPALIAAGFEVSASEAGLYLWVSRGENCWQTVSALAELGIISVPGEFYGEHGENFVRVSLTATDADVERAAARLQNALGY